MQQTESSMHYQVGGSLTHQSTSYIVRQADTDLYAALNQGEFCYILNARQMGKSSLLVRTKNRLQAEGYQCSVIDLTNIGSENITPLQWYKGLISDLWRGFNLFQQVNLKKWSDPETEFSLLQQLSHFILDVLLREFPDQQLIIFIDEIDSILSLPFPVDDFFALIRYCYNQRAINPEYNRLSFALFGVATPSDLIQAPTRTPFNIGCPIELSGFTFAEATPLTQGLSIAQGSPDAVLKAILSWSQGQPFLTQKLCQLVVDYGLQSHPQSLTIPPGTEDFWIKSLVQEKLIRNWQSQDEPEHLRTIRNRILSNPDKSGRLLGIYQQVLQMQMAEQNNRTEPVLLDDSPEQIELLLSGLVTKQDGCLSVKNKIYAEIFDLDWVNQQLVTLRPYAPLLSAWRASSQQDESRLLRGQALKDAQAWAQGKQLSDLDYQYLSASVESDRAAVQQALEAQRVSAVEAQLKEKQRTQKLQRRFLGGLSVALLVVTGFGILNFLQHRQVRVNEIEALISSAKGRFNSHQQLEALDDILAAEYKRQRLRWHNAELTTPIQLTLQEMIDRMSATHQFSIGTGRKVTAINADGDKIAVAAQNGTVTLWQHTGQQLRQFSAHAGEINSIAFSPNGHYLATSSGKDDLKLWDLEGRLVNSFSNLDAHFNKIRFSPDGTQIATTIGNHRVGARKLYFWDVESGDLQQEIPRQMAFAYSPNGEWIVALEAAMPRGAYPRTNRSGAGPVGEQTAREKSANERRARQVRKGKVLTVAGTVLAEFSLERGPVFALVVSPDSQRIAIPDPINGDVHLLDTTGNRVATLVGHRSGVQAIAFSPDGQRIATAGSDKVIKIWNATGSLIKTLSGHDATIDNLAFSADGQWLTSVSEDGMVRRWQPETPRQSILSSHQGVVRRLAFTPDGQQLITASVDKSIHIWTDRSQHRSQNESPDKSPDNVSFSSPPQKILPTSGIIDIRGFTISPQYREIVTVFSLGDVELRTATGELIQRLKAQGLLRGAVFSPDGNIFISGGADHTLKVWERDSVSGQFPSAPTRSIAGHQAPVTAVAFSPQGDLIASAARTNLIKLWRSDGTPVTTLSGHKGSIRKLAFSPDGDWIASASGDHTVKIWHKDGTLAHTLKSHQAAVQTVVFSPDGQYLASASVDSTIKLWTVDGTLVRTLNGHDGALNAVSFSPDGSHLASAGDDSHRVFIWHLGRILELDNVSYACEWSQDYLKNNPNVSLSAKRLCDVFYHHF